MANSPFWAQVFPERQKHAARPLTAPGFQPEGAEEHKWVNRHAMDSVIQAAKARPVRRVVYCSSWSSYGRLPAGTDVTEDTRSCAHDLIDPKCCCCGPAPSAVPYFESKFELEQQLREALTEGVHGQCDTAALYCARQIWRLWVVHHFREAPPEWW